MRKKDQDASLNEDAKAKIKRVEKQSGVGKADKPSAGETAKRTGGKFKKFWKDFRGELKKIVWPDGRTVLKNTGIVLATVLVVGVLIWVLDFGLTNGIRGVGALATRTQASETASEGTTLPINTEGKELIEGEWVPTTAAAPEPTTAAPTTTTAAE
ncbi:MAG: preprotein translocase subunit SecE [Oscillospiraceae bacterium]|jgi:preprotein translocase subunit SecE|nr:preprotein translocase subunit SecE [Oscillospiraceae bacterium]